MDEYKALSTASYLPVASLLKRQVYWEVEIEHIHLKQNFLKDIKSRCIKSRYIKLVANVINKMSLSGSQ